MQPDAVSQEFVRLGHEIARVSHNADGAQVTANSAIADISGHERLCAERYATINTSIGDLFKMLGRIQVLVYIGVGIWIGAPVVAGAMYGIMKMTGH